jgi:hypothetical protein
VVAHVFFCRFQFFLQAGKQHHLITVVSFIQPIAFRQQPWATWPGRGTAAWLTPGRCTHDGLIQINFFSKHRKVFSIQVLWLYDAAS